MTGSWKDGVSRRPLLAALGAVLGVGVVGGGVYEATALLHRRRGASAYEDLFAGLGDRETAGRLGDAVLVEAETFDARRIARDMRKRIDHRPLSGVLAEDLVQDRLVETQGWVLPETLALVCGILAKVS